MSTTYECPSCHRALAAPVDVAAKSVKCPACGTVFTAAAIDVTPVDDRFAIIEQKPARPVAFPAPAESPGDSRDLFPRRDVPPWADRELPDTGVLPGRRRATVAIACLVASALLSAIDVGVSALHLQLIQRAEQREPIADAAEGGEVGANAEEETMDAVEAVLGIATFAVRVGTIVAFCLWFYRAYKNLPFLMARNLSYSAGWAVGFFFVPILNLFRPYQIAQEIWQASDPNVSLVSWRAAAKSSIIRFWWAFWIIGGILGNISFRLTMAATTPSALKAALEFDMLSDLPEILAAGFAICMIVGIQQRQATKWQQLREELNPGETGKP